MRVSPIVHETRDRQLIEGFLQRDRAMHLYEIQVTAHLCKSLLAHVDTIGLNVRADNTGAIACYRALGFEPVADYEEVMLESR